MSDEVKEWPIDCPSCESGKLEASTIVFLDINKARILNDKTIELVDIEPSHLNDEYRGVPMDLEAGFVVSCDNCRFNFGFDFSKEFRAAIGAQPIGDAPREIGKRGGMDNNG